MTRGEGCHLRSEQALHYSCYSTTVCPLHRKQARALHALILGSYAPMIPRPSMQQEGRNSPQHMQLPLQLLLPHASHVLVHVKPTHNNPLQRNLIRGGAEESD